MCFTNVNEARIRYRYFMYSTNKCTDFNENITLKKKKKKNNKDFLPSDFIHSLIWTGFTFTNMTTQVTETVQYQDKIIII